MTKNLILFTGILFLFLTGCRYDNAIDLYTNGQQLNPVDSSGLMANIAFDNSIMDLSDRKIPVALQGDAVYVSGVNGVPNTAIRLNGFPQCIVLSNLDFNDTMSIFFWFKTDGLLAKTDSITLFDYGIKSFSLQIDGSTGSTLINTTHNDIQAKIPDWINSYNVWNYVYAEVGGGKFKVMYQGAMKNNEPIFIDTEIESPGTLNPLSDVLYIGRSSSVNNINQSYFKGSIDNIRVYNRMLSKSEILSLINQDTKK